MHDFPNFTASYSPTWSMINMRALVLNTALNCLWYFYVFPQIPICCRECRMKCVYQCKCHVCYPRLIRYLNTWILISINGNIRTPAHPKCDILWQLGFNIYESVFCSVVYLLVSFTLVCCRVPMTAFSSPLTLDVEKIKLEMLRGFHWRAFVHYSIFFISLCLFICKFCVIAEDLIKPSNRITKCPRSQFYYYLSLWGFPASLAPQQKLSPVHYRTSGASFIIRENWSRVQIRAWISILPWCCVHYSDFIMITVASQITGVSIVYSTVCSGAEQRNHQSSASLAFVRGIHR